LGVNTKYSAVIFDLFDTIVDFHYSKLPLVTVNGTGVHTTGRAVYEVFSAQYNGVDFERFYDVFKTSFEEFEELKRSDQREYPNMERFVLLLKNLGIDPGRNSAELAGRMSSAHMNTLRLGMEMGYQSRGVLDALHGKYRLGLISNFDHSPTIRSLIGDLNLTKYFEAVIISAETGWRKPRREIFNKCLDQMDIEAAEAVFVGDNYEADIVGAKSAGMDAIWIRKKGATQDADTTLPDHVITSLPEILEVL